MLRHWLPGDARGFVGQVWEHRTDDRPEKLRNTHNALGTRYDNNIPKLLQASREIMKGMRFIWRSGAEVLLGQFLETANFRGWELRAVAIMYNHFHIVVTVLGDPSPSKILGDFKSWGTRALSKRFGAPKSETWWTERGSKRKPNEKALAAGIEYVLYRQPRPLITWSPETGLCYGVPPRNRTSG